MKITFLGTGTSQGVPVIACSCEVCKSMNKKNKRLRSSVLITIDNKNYVIDSGPDFRQQMLRENVKHLNGLLFTHEHKDHTAGMDDIRAFNYIQKEKIKVYANKYVEKALKKEFHYVFSKIKYPGIPEIDLQIIDENTSFKLGNTICTPILVYHNKLPVLGFKIADFTYITDANQISEVELNKIKGTKILVINALRRKKHISHFTLTEALEIIEIIKPEKAYITHISHQMGLHDEIEKILYKNVQFAYDGLSIEI